MELKFLSLFVGRKATDIYMGIGMLLVVLGLVVHQFEAMIVKRHGQKHGKGGMFFNAIICLFALIYFFVTDKGGLQFQKGIVIYGLINSTMYALGFYSAYIAYKLGSFGLTRLFTSFRVIISTFYGIIFLNEPTSVFTYVALVMILISLFLMNYNKENETSQKISVKWIINVVLTVASNAAISIIGRMQFGVFGDTYKNEFLIISLSGAAISLFVLGLIFERNSFKATIKNGFLYGAAAGIFNGINSILIIVTYNYLPISFISPVKSGLSMVLSFLISIFLYKEKFTRRQLISVGIGIVAVILMNYKF